MVVPTKTAELYDKLAYFTYFSGLPNIGGKNFYVPKHVQNIHDGCFKISNFLDVIFIVLQCLSFWTQNNLNDQQKYYQLQFSLMNPFLFVSVLSFIYFKEDERLLVHNLVSTQHISIDESIERKMIREVTLYAAVTVLGVVMTELFYGIDSLIRVVRKDEVFTTIITAWPNVEDVSEFGTLGRILVYLAWFHFMVRVCGAVVNVLTWSITLRYLYKQLNVYFCNLNKIFQENISHIDKEKKYEEALIKGLVQHGQITGYTKLLTKVGTSTWASLILTNMTVTILGLLSLINKEDRTAAKILSFIAMVGTSTVATGCFMWTIGDISYEASELTNALYGSGWENCRGSARIKKMIYIAMSQTQQVLVIKTLFIVPMSYATHLSIIKTSYSIFSIFY